MTFEDHWRTLSMGAHVAGDEWAVRYLREHFALKEPDTKYSPDWISREIGQRTWLPVRKCSMCGSEIGFAVKGCWVWFRSDCDCSRLTAPDRLSSFLEIANLLALQGTDGDRDQLMATMKGERDAE